MHITYTFWIWGIVNPYLRNLLTEFSNRLMLQPGWSLEHLELQWKLSISGTNVKARLPVYCEFVYVNLMKWLKT